MWALNFSVLKSRRRSVTKIFIVCGIPAMKFCFRKPQQAAKCLKLNLRNGVAEEQMPFLGTGHAKWMVAGFWCRCQSNPKVTNCSWQVLFQFFFRHVPTLTSQLVHNFSHWRSTVVLIVRGWGQPESKAWPTCRWLIWWEDGVIALQRWSTSFGQVMIFLHLIVDWFDPNTFWQGCRGQCFTSKNIVSSQVLPSARVV